MSEASVHPCVLVVADPDRIGELVAILSELSATEVLVSSGGDDTIDLFEARRPAVVVLTATLLLGDPKSLIEALRGLAPRSEVAIVVIGDDIGPVRTALDALELAPDRFVTRPLSAKALRFAVSGGLDAVALVRGAPKPRKTPPPIPTRRAAIINGARAETTPPPPSAAPDRAALRARWEALADSFVDGADPAEGGDDAVETSARPPGAPLVAPSEPADEPAPLPPPMVIQPRRRLTQPPHGAVPPVDEVAPMQAWKPNTTDAIAPPREPTLIIRDPEPAVARTPTPPAVARTVTPDTLPAEARTRTGDGRVIVAARTSSDEIWSDPMPLAELLDSRDSKRDLEAQARRAREELPLDDFDDNLVIGREAGPSAESVLDDLPDTAPSPAPPESRDFARQLRAKMSMMAQRLFSGGEAAPPQPADLAPRHDHHTEIDLSALAQEPALGSNTEIEVRASRSETRDMITSPGSWDTQVRERGLPDHGEIMRGVSDAAMLLAKMFAQGSTGRIGFRRDEAEKVVFFDQGRPVFASSSEQRDRMGELLVREGKITAAQYERCQTVVAESGRRMGEILVDFGYLKRRELLPAVRRHVEDIVYSLFGWDRGTYHIAIEDQPSAERIRLSRHPASLVLEGVRRKLDRTSLEKLVGPPSTVIEVRDRERLGGIINMGDLSAEERGALGAFDGQADLSSIARAANVDAADVLPLAWGLCVLGLATARRTDTEVHDESTALVGETDLSIDRERVRARWQLVTESDYFALLGVRRDATTFEIRRAYQSARRDFAADCFPSDLRRELAQELDDIAHVLDEAFRVLRDDRLRHTYLQNLIE